MEKINLLLSKLRQPVHISFISSNILMESEEKTMEVIKDLLIQGLIEEVGSGKGYFKVRS